MDRHQFHALARSRPLLLDGATGTELMKRGLPAGAPPEEWVMHNPRVIQALHEEYFEDLDSVVRIKELTLDAFTEEEALIQLDLLGHDFYVYKNSDNGLVNVMYRRKDGSYGIIKPRD